MSRSAERWRERSAATGLGTRIAEVTISIERRPGSGEEGVRRYSVSWLDDAAGLGDWNRTSDLVVPDHAL